MGNIIQPVCKCKSEFKELFIGVGMMETEKFKIPTPCYHCGTIFIKNLYEKNPRCPNSNCRRKVIPFGEVTDYESDIEGIMEWDLDLNKRYVLEDKKYKCPKCFEVELTLLGCGLWD